MKYTEVPIYLDKTSKLKDNQITKMNSIVRVAYTRFTNKVGAQKQADEPLTTSNLSTYSGRLTNVRDFNYAGLHQVNATINCSGIKKGLSYLLAKGTSTWTTIASVSGVNSDTSIYSATPESYFYIEWSNGNMYMHCLQNCSYTFKITIEW